VNPTQEFEDPRLGAFIIPRREGGLRHTGISTEMMHIHVVKKCMNIRITTLQICVSTTN
jgi:hypothetical protein